MTRWADALRIVGMAAVALLGAWLYAMVDTMAVPFWFPVAFGAVWSLFLIPFSFWMAKRPWGALYGVFLLALLVIWATPWDTRKAFRRDAQSIRPGMTVAQVEKRLGRWVEGAQPVMGEEYGWSGRQRGRYVEDPWSVTDGDIAIPGGVAYRRDPDAADALSADWAMVTIEGGRVTRTEFVYD